MAPQVGKGFNRDKWNELEKYVRFFFFQIIIFLIKIIYLDILLKKI
jgi:DNA/RNA endonuclease G (NUC1)